MRIRFPSVTLLAMSITCMAAQAQTNLAVITPDAAWTWYNDPRALFHNGILYSGYVRGSDGKTALTALNPLTGVRSDVWVSGFTQVDDHNNPGLLAKADGTLLAIYARHGSDQTFAYRRSISTNPVSSTDWFSEQVIASTGVGLTYANPYQLSAEAGRIYNFARNQNFNPTVFTSDTGGATWSSPQLMIRTGTGGTRPYMKYCSDGIRRIDFLYTDGHPRNSNNSLYHLYYREGMFYKTDSSALKSFAALPILHDSGERGSVIYQYSDAATADPNSHIASGRAWCWEIVSGLDGHPVCVFTVQKDDVTGENDGTATNFSNDRIYYYYARWTGSGWQKRFIAHAGRPLYASEDDYAGGICIDPRNPNTLYISTSAAAPFDLSLGNTALRTGSRYEIFKGITYDGGLTFTWSQVTSNSAVDNLRPYIPRGQSGVPAVIWFRGNYTTFTSYACEAVGLFPNPVPAPPIVRIESPAAGLVIMTNLSNRLEVRAVAEVNGAPVFMPITWETADGPAPAQFASAGSANTLVGFPTAGVYTLLAQAGDPQGLQSTAEMTVRAGPLPDAGVDPSHALWLKLDETSGLTASDSAGQNNGTLTGGTTWQPAGGVRGGALKFDGVSGQVEVPDAPSLDGTAAFTLAFWFRADAYPADSAGLVSKREGISNNNAFTTWLKGPDKRVYVDIDGSNNRFASATRFGLGKWHHIAIVFNGALPSTQRAQLWANGVPDVVASESSSVLPDYDSNIRLGNTHPGAVNWFNGAMDDVRFYRRALDPGEIIGLAQSKVTPSVDFAQAPAVTNSVEALLHGTVAHDGQSGPLQINWEVVEVAGDVQLENTNAAATTVLVNRSGAYMLRLWAADSQARVAKDLEFVALPNINTYLDWIAQHYQGTNASPGADPELDGVCNLTEFALGLSPVSHDATPFDEAEPGVAGLPIGRILNFDGTDYMSLIVRRPAGRIGIAVGAEASGDLIHWVPINEVTSPSGSGIVDDVFRDDVPAIAPQRFLRLQVIQTE